MYIYLFIYLFIHLFRVYPYQRSHQGVPPIVTPRPPPPGPNMTDCTHPLGAGPSNNVIPLQQFSHLLNKMSQMMMMMMTSRQR